MPSNKIYAVLVLCVAIVVSIWLIGRKPTSASPAQDAKTVSVIDHSNQNTGTSTEWQKILTDIDSSSQNVTSVVPKDSEDTFDDTTLTAQMAKDFFGRYLSIAKNGDVSAEDAASIADSILTSPEYTKATGAVYLAANLHINPKTDTATTKKYFDTLNTELKTKIPNNNDDPMAIVGKAVQNNNENELKKLDLLITTGRTLVSDLLAMEVPADAVSVHLALLNSGSNLLSNMEAMRMTFSDPIRSFAGASQYRQHLTEFLGAVNGMSVYFAKKLY